MPGTGTAMWVGLTPHARAVWADERSDHDPPCPNPVRSDEIKEGQGADSATAFHNKALTEVRNQLYKIKVQISADSMTKKT